MNNQIVIADSCFWLALLDHKDPYHSEARSLNHYLANHTVVLPWPCLYETICTRLVRDRSKVLELEELLNSPYIIRQNDEKYRETALLRLIELSRLRGYTYSLVDSVIREMILDRNLRIRYLLTFNKNDFCDLENRNFEIV